MNHFTLRRHAAWTALFALGMLAVLAGCSKKVTSVDAGHTTLDGRPEANSRLLAWRDAPVSIVVWADLGPAGPDPLDADVKYDTLIGRTNVSWGEPGAVQLAVLDETPASAYQFYHYASNGGLEPLSDYAIRPMTKWLVSNWEMYALSDGQPSGYSPTTYMARGLLDGKVTTSSPLTNSALPDGQAPAASTQFFWSINPADSSIGWTWTTTPGAAGYWLDVYQFTGEFTALDFYSTGAPNPVLVGSYISHKVVEYWPAAVVGSASKVGRMNVQTFAGPGPDGAQAQAWLRTPGAGATSARSLGAGMLSRTALAGPVNARALAAPRVTGPVRMDALGAAAYTAAPAGARSATAVGPDFLQESKLFRGQTYFARVTAVDAHGKVLSWMAGDTAFLQGDGFYYYVPLGAAVISLTNQ